MLKWEMIIETSWIKTSRLKVPGGWLVHRFDKENEDTGTMCFVVDSKHEWKIE